MGDEGDTTASSGNGLLGRPSPEPSMERAAGSAPLPRAGSTNPYGIPVTTAAARALELAIAEAVQQRSRTAVLIVDLGSTGEDRKSGPDAIPARERLVGRLHLRSDDPAPIVVDDRRIVLVLRDLADSLEAFSCARATLDAVAALRYADESPCELSMRIGIGLFPEDGDVPRDLLDAAATALEDLRITGQAGAAFCYRRRQRRVPVTPTGLPEVGPLTAAEGSAGSATASEYRAPEAPLE